MQLWIANACMREVFVVTFVTMTLLLCKRRCDDNVLEPVIVHNKH